MRFILLSVLVASGAMGAGPYFGLKANQPVSDNMRNTYGMMPVLSAGVRFPRSENLALLAGLSGTYAQGLSDFKEYNVWDATLRFGLEFTPSVILGWYLTPGMMLAYASERMPNADTLGNITHSSYGGASLGLFLDSGVMMFQAAGWDFCVQAGADILSVPTNKSAWEDSGWLIYLYPYRYSIDLSAINLGLVMRKTGGK
jgi:hypothetical protein